MRQAHPAGARGPQPPDNAAAAGLGAPGAGAAARRVRKPGEQW